MRCAIYARYSSDLQRASSIEDQVRRCREYAARQGWVVLEEFVRSDQAITGAAMEGRRSLTTLITAAQVLAVIRKRRFLDGRRESGGRGIEKLGVVTRSPPAISCGAGTDDRRER